MYSSKQRHALWQKITIYGFLLPFLIFGLGFLQAFLGSTNRAEAATANTLNFQGRLLSNTGALVPDGSYNIEFKIYDDETAGTNWWTETRSGGNAVSVQNGYFSIYLGDVAVFPANVPWDQELWLTMNVSGDGEMTPRFKLTAVPYAFRAGALVDASGNAKTADDFAQITPGAVQVANAAVAALRLNQTGAGGLLQLQGNGVDVATIDKTGTAVLGGSLTTNGSQFTNNGSTLNNALTLTNFAAGGPIGTAAATVDIKTAILIPQTTAAIALTLPNPTTTTAGRLIYVGNTGSTSFTLNGTTVGAGSSVSYVWNGTAWSLAGSPGSADTLQNAYDNSTGAIITTTSTDSTLRVRDATVSFGNTNVLSVQNNAGSIDYFGVQGDGDVSINTRLGIGTTAPTASLNVTTATPTAVAGATGTAQINVSTLTGGVGGSTTIATTGTGGVGGGFTYLGGTGGTAASALTASVGGAGGATSLTSGSGGSAAVAGTGNNTGGAGGAFTLLSGTGGNATGATTGNNTGGAGGAFTLQAGTGGTATIGTGNLVGGAGGALTLRGGTGGVGSTSGGSGGAVTIQGGTAAAMAGAAGGGATVTGAAGSATGSGGNGGALSLTAGSAGGDNTVNRTGGAVTISAGASRGASTGGALTLNGGSGGSNLTTGSATGPASGGITINAGNGGTAPNATTLSVGGAAGGLTFNGGTGGAASVAGTGNNTGGAGGNSIFTGGNGGAANGATTGTNTGGAGGGYTFQGGTGGAATTGSGSLIGGTGGALSFSGGTGGVGVTSGGNGGGITIQGGQAAAMAGAAGGSVSISGRAGSTTGTGGNGGGLSLTGGAAGGNGLVARSGGGVSLTAGASNGGAAGGAVTLTAGAGGNNATAGTATGGNAGGITFNGSNGGTAPNATVSSTGGTAGGFTVNGGTGGNAAVAGTGNNTGGNGGAFTLGAGTGGNATGATTGINTGGLGGTLSLTAGNGGSATTGSGTLQGGNGGSLAFSAGRGGAGTATGVGGDITFSTTPTTAAQTERLRVTNSGYIGIGTGTTTSLPNARLTVVAENTTTSQIKLRSSRSAIVANNVVGGLDFDTNDTNLTAPGVTSARIQAIATASQGAATYDTALVFSTASGVTLAERWRIGATGELQGNGASTIRANAGNLTIATLTSGNVIINGAGTFEVQDDINITSNQFTNSASTVNTAQAIGNDINGGNIGTSAATTVDVDTAFILTQTTAGQTMTLFNPTSATVGRIVYVTNSPSSTTTFTLYSVVIPVGGTQGYIWNGSAWTALNVATAGGGVTAMGLIDSVTKSSNGAVVSGTDLIMQTADATNPGLVSTGAQTFAGAKTFSGAANFTSTGTALSVTNDINIGGATTTGTLNVSGLTTLSGNVVAAGSATGTTGTTSGTGTSTTTLTLSADVFSVNDVIYIDNAGQDYYTRVTVDPGTGSYTVSPAITFENSRTVTKYTVQNIGATSSDYTTQANRFFQGYFLGGVTVGAGSTTLADGLLQRTTGDITINPGSGGVVQVNGTINATTISGDGSGITNIDGSSVDGSTITSLDASNISSGTLADARLSSNVTLQGNTFNGVNQLVRLDGSGNLPALNGAALTNLSAANLTGTLAALDGSALTSLNASNISTGTLSDARLTSNVTLLGNTFNGISQLVQLNGSGALPALNGASLTGLTAANLTGALPAISGASLTSLNGSNISSGTVGDARLSANVTLQGNTFNGVNQLVQLGASGELPALNGAGLTTLNASNISSGTVADSRLSASVTLLGNTFNGISQLVQLNGSGALPALNGASLTNLSAANITGVLAALDGSALTSLNATNIASGTVADTRLSANVTLQGNTFNGVSQLVRLDASGNLPALNGAALTNLSAGNLTGPLAALNGSALTSLNATNISSGTLADGRLSTNVTLLGNTFNGVSQLVQLNGSGALPALNGANLTSLSAANLSGALPAISGVSLTSLNATNIASGTVADARLSGNVALLNGGQTFSTLTAFGAGLSATGDINATGAVAGATISGNGSALTSLNATNISSGTVGDSRLSTNVALLTGAQSFSGTKSFASGGLVLGQSTLSSAATVARAVGLPDEAGTICLSNKDTCGYIRLASGVAQTDATTNNVISINKTNATGSLIDLQRSGGAVFTVANSGALQIQATATSALDIRNVGGVSYFTVDTNTGSVVVGGGTADANGVLFVLDTRVAEPTGTNGGSYYNSSTGRFRCYENNAWTNCIDSWTTIKKIANEPIANDNTLSNDNTLFFTMAANTTYSIQCKVFFDTAATPDFKYATVGPAAPTLVRTTRYHVVPGSTAYVNAFDQAATASTSVTGTGTNGGYVTMETIWQNGASAGTWAFQWAQNTSNAATTTVRAGSYCEYSTR